MILVDGGATGPARATFILAREPSVRITRRTCVCRRVDVVHQHIQRDTTGIFRLSEYRCRRRRCRSIAAPFSFGTRESRRDYVVVVEASRISRIPLRTPDTDRQAPCRALLCHAAIYAHHRHILASSKARKLASRDSDVR